MTPEVSVVILTHNRIGALRGCVDALMRHTRRSLDRCEVIVVDNGSTDGTVDWLTRFTAPWLKPVFRETNEGVCARNYGLEVAGSELIACVDDDVLVSRGWDDTLLAPLLDRADVGGTGQHGFYQDPSWRLLIDDRRRPTPGQFADLLMGFCWAWRQTKPGIRYDTDFNPFWHEESDLQLQIRAMGKRLMMTRPVATHNSLHNWQDTMAHRGPTSEKIAERNFFRLREKWLTDKRLVYEGPLVGLTS